MTRFFVFVIVFIVVNSFVMLEEESLVVIASFIWLDAAGGAIREALTSELEGRGDAIKETFSWYLNAKKNLVNLLISKHTLREGLSKNISGVYELYLEKLLSSILVNYGKTYSIVSNFERRNDIVEAGMGLVNELSRKEMQLVLGYPGNWEFDSINKGTNWLDKSIKGELLLKK